MGQGLGKGKTAELFIAYHDSSRVLSLCVSLTRWPQLLTADQGRGIGYTLRSSW
jgi:hypothetical protein